MIVFIEFRAPLSVPWSGPLEAVLKQRNSCFEHHYQCRGRGTCLVQNKVLISFEHHYQCRGRGT